MLFLASFSTTANVRSLQNLSLFILDDTTNARTPPDNAESAAAPSFVQNLFHQQFSNLFFLSGLVLKSDQIAFLATVLVALLRPSQTVQLPRHEN